MLCCVNDVKSLNTSVVHKKATSAASITIRPSGTDDDRQWRHCSNYSKTQTCPILGTTENSCRCGAARWTAVTTSEIDDLSEAAGRVQDIGTILGRPIRI